MSPLQILESIVDEVDGLRRTDPRSFLPHSIMRAAREAIAPSAAGLRTGNDAQLRSVSDLQGHTIAHVFESAKSGEMVLLCSDHSFIVLDVDSTDDDASINVLHWGVGRPLTDYVYPVDLLAAGLISTEEKKRIETEQQQARVDAARKQVERARKTLEDAQATLNKLLPQWTARRPADGYSRDWEVLKDGVLVRNVAADSEVDAIAIAQQKEREAASGTPA